MKTQGFSLLEVLVAVLVLAIGLLGLAGMQLKVLQGSQSAYQRTLASVIAADGGERLWSNSAAAAPLSMVAIQQQWLADWTANGRMTLPGLALQITEPAAGATTYVLNVSWTEKRFSGAETSSFSYALDLYP